LNDGLAESPKISNEDHKKEKYPIPKTGNKRMGRYY